MTKNKHFSHLCGGSKKPLNPNKEESKTKKVSYDTKIKKKKDSLSNLSLNQIVVELNLLNNKLYNNTSKIITKNSREESEIDYDVYTNLLEDKIFDESKKDEDIPVEYSYYPEFNNKYFNKKILQKKEFYKYLKPSIKKQGFNLTNAQKFVKNYISKETPYNGILLWWGVGVGKTCGALSIAENFKKDLSKLEKRTLILTPSATLHDTWIKEIFNVEKEINKTNFNVQCTRNSYIPEFQKINQMAIIDEKKKKNLFLSMKKVVGKYYELLGYQGLVNKIKKISKKYEVPRHIGEDQARIHFIREYFSNRVIIMDEVHVTREGDVGKLVPPYLELIARYAVNTKIILLTATPFFNDAKEILWLLKLLLINDKRSPLFAFDIFNKDNNLKDGFEDILINKSRGYISYLRGSHPSIFPIRLQPVNIFNYRDSSGRTYWENISGKKLRKNMLVYTPRPVLPVDKINMIELNGNIDIGESRLLSDEEHIQSMKFINCEMSEYQYSVYSDVVKRERGGFRSGSIETSNIALEDGFPYRKNSNGKLECKVQYLNKGIPITHISRLQEYSSKFYNLLNIIKNSKGIVFIYSRLIDKGIKMFASILEENGAARYEGLENITGNKFSNNITKKHTSRTNDIFDENTKYIYIDGSTDKNKLTKLIDELNGTPKNPNKEGDHIKIILGSGVISQGINMKRVREIHIIDPWYNLSLIEQVIGRGTRTNSHMQLVESKRNITIFLYCATLGKHPNNIKNNQPLYLESSDEYMYRLAFHKKKKDSRVGRVLKRNSIDCYINKKQNFFDKVSYPEEDIINSRNDVMRISKGDEDYSIECEFQKCNFKCIPELSIEDITVNFDTYSSYFSVEEIDEIKDYIKYLFSIQYIFTLSDIKNHVIHHYSNIDVKYVYLALDEMIKHKEMVYDKNGRIGYILYRFNSHTPKNGIYIYQPKDLKDETVPLLYRYYPLVNNPDGYLIKESNKKKTSSVHGRRRTKNTHSTSIKKPGKKMVITSKIIDSVLSKIKEIKGWEGKNNILVYFQSTFKNKRYQDSLDKETLSKLIRFAIIDRESYEIKTQLLKYILKKKYYILRRIH